MSSDVSQGFSVCERCKAGTYAAEEGLVQCPKCPGGRWQNLKVRLSLLNELLTGVGKGETSCKDTPRGFFSPEGAEKYEVCRNREVAPFANMARCIQCDQNSINNDDFTECVCNPGFFAYSAAVNTTLLQCYECPAGANCERRGVRWDTMEAIGGGVVLVWFCDLFRPGWWRGSNDTDVFYRCLVPSHVRSTPVCLSDSLARC